MRLPLSKDFDYGETEQLVTALPPPGHAGLKPVHVATFTSPWSGEQAYEWQRQSVSVLQQFVPSHFVPSPPFSSQ